MSDNGFRIVALNAVLVIACGMFVGGIPLVFVVAHEVYGQAVHVPGDYRAWLMAHLEGLLNGLLMIALVSVARLRPLAATAERWLVPSLLVAGWGNTLAAVAAPLLGVRGMVLDADPANDVVALAFTLALAGSIVALAIVVRHLWSRS